MVLALAGACARGGERAADSAAARSGAAGAERALVVYNAGSLAAPLRAALDSFALREGVTVSQESAGSLETARKLTELHKVPDVIALADYEVFPQLLMPDQVNWYARFARNRMVLAYTTRSKYATEISGDNWWQIVQRPGVEVGRADPNLDPNGYRTLLTWQLAERHYKQPGLVRQLTRHLPVRNIRPKEADLVALLQAGELDYVWSYESIARAANLPFVRLPDEIDLGTANDSALYAVASVKVRGRTAADSLEFHGEPIVYAFSIPLHAPHPEHALRFAAYLVSVDGRRVLRAAGLDAIDPPRIVGEGAPPGVAAADPQWLRGSPDSAARH
jgi:molybdate/tungstate transport system substrate-binding protein